MEVKKKRGRPKKISLGNAIKDLQRQGMEGMLSEADKEAAEAFKMPKEGIDIKTKVEITRVKADAPYCQVFEPGALKCSKDKIFGTTAQLLFWLMVNCDYGNWVRHETQAAAAVAIGRTRVQVNKAFRELLKGGYISVFMENGINKYKIRCGDIFINPDYIHKGRLNEKQEVKKQYANNLQQGTLFPVLDESKKERA